MRMSPPRSHCWKIHTWTCLCYVSHIPDTEWVSPANRTITELDRGWYGRVHIDSRWDETRRFCVQGIHNNADTLLARKAEYIGRLAGSRPGEAPQVTRH